MLGSSFLPFLAFERHDLPIVRRHLHFYLIPPDRHLKCYPLSHYSLDHAHLPLYQFALPSFLPLLRLMSSVHS